MEENNNGPAAFSKAETQQELILQLETSSSPDGDREEHGRQLSRVQAGLNRIDREVSQGDFERIVRTIYKQLDGDDGGVVMLDRWSLKGHPARSRSAIESLWASCRPATEIVSAAPTPIETNENNVVDGVVEQLPVPEPGVADVKVVATAALPTQVKVAASVVLRFSLNQACGWRE